MENYNLEQFRQLIETRLREVSKAVTENDLSQAQFPRTGETALIELLTRRDVLTWVIEMMPTDKQAVKDAKHDQ